MTGATAGGSCDHKQLTIDLGSYRYVCQCGWLSVPAVVIKGLPTREAEAILRTRRNELAHGLYSVDQLPGMMTGA